MGMVLPKRCKECIKQKNQAPNFKKLMKKEPELGKNSDDSL